MDAFIRIVYPVGMEKISLINKRYLLTILVSLSLIWPAANAIAADEANKEIPVAVYLPLKPKFIVNLAGKRHYLRAEIQLKMKDDAAKAIAQQHSAALRHAIILTLSDNQIEEITTMEGREGLRKKTTDAVKQALKTYANVEGVEDLFFTDYVAQ